MATVTSIFIQSELPLDTIAADINLAVGIHLQPEQRETGPCYACEALGILFVLFDDHGLEDDMGIDFSSYKYELDLEVYRYEVDHDLADAVQQSVTLLLHSKLKRRFKSTSIAVANFQQLLAK